MLNHLSYNFYKQHTVKIYLNSVKKVDYVSKICTL